MDGCGGVELEERPRAGRLRRWGAASSPWASQAALVVLRPEVREHLRRLVHGITSDSSLQDELMQEALICFWQSEAEAPGHTASWYTQRCGFRMRDYFRAGRSVDSSKRRGLGCPINGPEEFGLAAEDDVVGEVCAREEFRVLLSHLDVAQQRTLSLLSEGMTVREVAQKLHTSHVAVIGRRRRIAATAAGLGLHP